MVAGGAGAQLYACFWVIFLKRVKIIFVKRIKQYVRPWAPDVVM